MPAENQQVNDIHSQLNATTVASIVEPKSIEDVVAVIKDAQKNKQTICIAGGRHSMGGQQFGMGSILLDMRSMNRILHFDTEKGFLNVEAGVEWPEIIDYLTRANKESDKGWSIIQKQTGADKLTIGGALSSNVHGRGLRLKPCIDDVESFELVDASGAHVHCSRSENTDLFQLVIGGYGLFGVIVTVVLRLRPREVLRRVVEIVKLDDVFKKFNARIADGFQYGDWQFMTNEQSDDFLKLGILSCYQPAGKEAKVPEGQKELSEDDWAKLSLLGHTDKRAAWEQYSRYYLSTSGQVYSSDYHQLSYYPDHYHQFIDSMLHTPDSATEMITEVYVPREHLADFLREVADDFRKNQVNLFYGTVRLIEKDNESFLVWAKESYACTVLNVHMVHTPDKLKEAADTFRRLIDYARKRGGSYFLTYHRYATREQVIGCYPQFVEFMEQKKRLDPQEIFQSNWYRHYKEMFADVV